MSHARRALLSLPLLSVLLAACQSAPPPVASTAAPVFPEQEYRQLAAGDGTVYRLAPDASSVRIHVFRAGALARQGHNHVITAPAFEGALYLPESGLAGARFDVVVPLDRLRVDPEAERAELGGSFAGEVDDEAREGTRDNMLGPDGLDAARYPTLAVRSLAVAGEAPMLAVKVAIELHGVRREQWLPVELRENKDGLEASGALVIHQRDFGITPFSALGGLLQVQDALVITFRLAATRAD